MKYTLRADQATFIGDIRNAWNQGARVVVGVASTGFGKTVCLGQLVDEHPGASCVIAHRQELVGQISLTLARYGVRHNIVAAEATVRAIAALHVLEFGMCYYAPSARCAVASVDTLVRRDDLAAWMAQVTLWINDEGHHVVRGNKWANAIAKFTHPAARGLLPTATPHRADGKGLGRQADGIADVMVQAPPMRWLIEQGFLTDYRIVCVESDLRKIIEQSSVGASGDWSPQQGRAAAEKSHIVGDVVKTYLQFARGLRHVTFSTDTQTAADITAAYIKAGVRAACLTGKTQDGLRRHILRQFERGEIDEIVAVDIISEGFDLPAIEAISFARPTKSLALYMQQFGRCLRPMPGKQKALVIDHVGNFIQPDFGPPDRPRVWTLERRGRGTTTATDAIPMRVCLACYEPYARLHRECPHCGHYPEPGTRSTPAQVDGDLAEMSPELLAKLRGDVTEATQSVDDLRWSLQRTGLPAIPIMGHCNRQAEKLDTLARLRDAMAVWGGRWHAAGEDDARIQRRFFHTFGVDVLTAQALPRAEAQALLDKLGGTR
jgi:DNA repair protein RadD